MFARSATAALAALGLWALGAPAQDLGGKVYRLGDLPTQLVDNEDEGDTELVGYRGYRGYSRGFYGGYRGYYGSYYRGNYGYRGGYGYRSYYGYRPYYNSYRYNYAPRYFNYYNHSYYTPNYYYSTPYYYYSPISVSAFPCVGTTTFSATVGSYAVPRAVEPMSKPREDNVVPPQPRQEGTFPYDGGPTRPVPMPSAEPEAQPQPQKAAPIDPSKGRIVSLPARSTKFAYPAYGEKTAPSGFASERPILLKSDPVTAARR